MRSFHALQPTGVLQVVLAREAVVHHIVLARTDPTMDGRPTRAADCDVVVEGVRREEATGHQPVQVGRDRHLQGIGPNPIDADHQYTTGLFLGGNNGRAAQHHNGEGHKSGEDLHPYKIRPFARAP